ncbi:MAG: restriction endonuclease subunit S [Bacteroidetes bacterium]|nr:restriction endonuclease subunit S [Bacteroidota bacterium]
MLTKEAIHKGYYRHEKFGIVPTGWDVVRLGDYFDFFPTASYSRSLLTETGECLYIHYGDLHTKFERFIDADKDELPFITKEMAKKYTSVAEGDLIISDASEDYEGVGKAVEVINVGEKTIISGLHTLHLRAKNNEFINGFKGYILNESRVRNGILRIATGIKVYSVSKTELRKIYLPKPPVEEQQAIAAILSKVDEAIKATENSIKAAEKLKRSLMQNLLTGKLKPDGTWRNEDEFYKHEKFGNCPVGWHWGRLSEIADVIAGQSPSGEYYNEDGIGTPMLNGPTEFTDLHPIPIQFTTKVTKLCRIGDILFTVRGSSTGRMNIADQEYCIGRGIAAIRAKERSDIDFIYYTLVTISEKILAEAKGAGTTFPNVSRGELLKKWVLIPDTDQSEISAKIKSVDAFLNEKERKVITTRRLKKSLMQNLLTGKVRVDINKIENILADATV